MADLYARLKAIRERKMRDGQSIPFAPNLNPENSFSAETKRNSIAALDFETTNEWKLVGELVWARQVVLEIPAHFWGLIGGSDQSSDFIAELDDGFFCIDTETTGLSGGAGTIPFLIGWCRRDGARAVLSQFFLQDFGGEPEMVSVVGAELELAKGLCSYNGASFDLPLLRMRWALNGKLFPVLPHTDCLYSARRLWKRAVGSCSLKNIESAVLGIVRNDDIPGALVPQKYFDYLRRGAGTDFPVVLGDVFRHHAQDVLSLLCLNLLTRAIQKNPAFAHWESLLAKYPPDAWGLLHWCTPEQRFSALESNWVKKRDVQWGLAYAAACRAIHTPESYAKARAVWMELWQSQGNLQAFTAWLKLVEHRQKEPTLWKQALDEIELALASSNLHQLFVAELVKRKGRIHKRLALKGL